MLLGLAPKIVNIRKPPNVVRYFLTSLKTYILAATIIGSLAIYTQAAKAQSKTAQVAATQAPLTKAQLTKVKRLDKIQKKIKTDNPDMRHVSRAGLQVWLTNNHPNIVLLDTRPVSEYRVSHIKGAVQIDPDSQARKLAALELGDKIVIVYCSVGRRSTDLATRLNTELSAAGAQTVMNLEGGIFGWHNDGRALVNANGPTDMVHPYNGFWGSRYIARKNKTAYSLK